MIGSYLSTAAEEIGADNFFARESRLDLENVCSEAIAEPKSGNETRTEMYNDLTEEEVEDPALVEKVRFIYGTDTLNFGIILLKFSY